MILLDTHVWVWWVHGDDRLSKTALNALDLRSNDEVIGISAISCWEVAMLQIRSRLVLPCSLDEWLDQSLNYPGVREVDLTRSYLVDSCRLPGEFHKDPADRILVATARALDCDLITADETILTYAHVNAIHPEQMT